MQEIIEHRSFSIHSQYTISHSERCRSNNIYTHYTGCAKKSDTLVNYVNIVSYKLQNTGYLHCLNNFNICYH